MTLTPKETSLLKDLREQEMLCTEKYNRYANQACDQGLKALFEQIEQTEQQHLQTLGQIASGTAPQMQQQQQQTQAPKADQAQKCSQADWQKDSYLCADALAMEKHVAAEYNTSIFEFRDENVRNALNHIQAEEQQHGLQLYQYMKQNNMYN